MAISEGEYILMNMQIPKMVRDGRTTGAQDWITDGLTKRPVIDDAEEQTLRSLFGMAPAPLPVISWTILQRIPTVA
jgi:hypothetical protein